MRGSTLVVMAGVLGGILAGLLVCVLMVGPKGAPAELTGHGHGTHVTGSLGSGLKLQADPKRPAGAIIDGGPAVMMPAIPNHPVAPVPRPLEVVQASPDPVFNPRLLYHPADGILCVETRYGPVAVYTNSAMVSFDSAHCSALKKKKEGR